MPQAGGIDRNLPLKTHANYVILQPPKRVYEPIYSLYIFNYSNGEHIHCLKRY